MSVLLCSNELFHICITYQHTQVSWSYSVNARENNVETLVERSIHNHPEFNKRIRYSQKLVRCWGILAKIVFWNAVSVRLACFSNEKRKRQ